MNNRELKIKAFEIKKNIIKMLNKAGSGHPAGAIGLAEIYSVLYFDKLKHNPKKPNWSKRDYVIVSNGHTCPVLYSTLAESGYFPTSELTTLRKMGSRLQGHPHLGSLPGVENTSGPLGQGVSIAVGLAADLKRNNKDNKVYLFVGDGEIQEGQCWEAFLFAAKEKLDNLIVIVDYNHIQIDGNPDEMMHIDPLSKKFRAFNFQTIEFDGNNVSQISHAIDSAHNLEGKPVCLIADTIPGCGISFMENKKSWHGKVTTNEETKIAIDELNFHIEELLDDGEIKLSPKKKKSVVKKKNKKSKTQAKIVTKPKKASKLSTKKSTKAVKTQPEDSLYVSVVEPSMQNTTRRVVKRTTTRVISQTHQSIDVSSNKNIGGSK